MTIGGCRRTNRRKMSEETKPKSYPWKTVGYFDSFEEADKKRNALLGGARSMGDTSYAPYAIQAKVKRCSEGGKQFMVKARLDPTKNPPKEKKQKKKQKKK